MTTTTAQTPTKGEYNDAAEKLSEVFGDIDAAYLIEMIQTVRDDETFHDPDAERDDACAGCLAEKIADAVTRAVNGKAA